MKFPFPHKMSLLILGAILLFALPAQAAPPPQAEALACDEIYVVQSNDWLSKIADKFLGSPAAFQAIVNATNQQHQADDSFPEIADANVIETGWRLCVPAADQAVTIVAQAAPVLSSTLQYPDMPPPPPNIPPVYTLDTFVAEFAFGPDVNPQWIYSTPEPVARFEVSPEMEAIDDAYGYRANYYWNDNLEDRYFIRSGIFDAVPPEVKVFEPWTDNVLPRYRYPPSVTLPTGLTTNQYGWRGKPLAMQKPANTIRIAALGASTTVGGHGLPHSYPEYLEHWLNLWSQENGYGVNFEVINAGREGLNSNDIMVVAQFEVIPMDVDYVIYYEGSNQFHPENVINFPPEYTVGRPPAGVVPNLNNVESDDKTLLDYLAEYSALAARARNIVEQFLITGQEPPKPEQAFVLPAGLDELNPDPATVGGILELDRILRHMGVINDALTAEDARLLISTFNWFAYDGMVLDPSRHRNLYSYINRVHWPFTYANIRRTADFQNRVFVNWAEQNGVGVVDVAGRMPRQPDLFDDAIHNTALGTRIRAWVNFETLVPLLKQDIESGRLPRAPRFNYTEHPYLTDEYRIRELPVGQ